MDWTTTGLLLALEAQHYNSILVFIFIHLCEIISVCLMLYYDQSCLLVIQWTTLCTCNALSVEFTITCIP